MKRKLIIDSSKSLFEMQIDDDSYKLIHSDLDKEWTQPNKVVAELNDTHNFVKIKLGNKKLKFDYSEAYELFLLLREYNLNEVIREAEINYVGM